MVQSPLMSQFCVTLNHSVAGLQESLLTHIWIKSQRRCSKVWFLESWCSSVAPDLVRLLGGNCRPGLQIKMGSPETADAQKNSSLLLGANANE